LRIDKVLGLQVSYNSKPFGDRAKYTEV